jgi:uncharacterized membrane protein
MKLFTVPYTGPSAGAVISHDTYAAAVARADALNVITPGIVVGIFIGAYVGGYADSTLTPGDDAWRVLSDSVLQVPTERL